MIYPEIGEVWRKCGPSDWIKIVGIQLPGHPDYDGGLPGVSVVSTNGKGNWRKNRWFWTCRNYDDFKLSMQDTGRRKITSSF